MNGADGQGWGWFRRGLSLIIILVVGWQVSVWYVRGTLLAWSFGCLAVALVAWLLLAFLSPRFRRVGLVLVLILVVAGALATPATNGLAIAPVVFSVLWVARDLSQPIARSVTVGLVAMLVLLVGDVLHPVAPLGVVAMEAGVVVAFLSGQSRRQFLIADERSRQFVTEQARADVFEARQQIAHDIHDVLAHSLGGLVIQLDAVDALLESGETAAAAGRIRDARVLAADGLSEARRAVAALREGPLDASQRVPGDGLVADVAALLAAHRELGGLAEFAESGSRRDVSEGVEAAIRRAVQEGLTNSRKHAPGEPVEVRLDWRGQDIALRIDNPIAARSSRIAASGGGHGLVGMRERFAALPGGRATAGVEAGRFVVKVEASTS